MEGFSLLALQTVFQGAVYCGFVLLAGVGIVRYYFHEKGRFTDALIAPPDENDR